MLLDHVLTKQVIHIEVCDHSQQSDQAIDSIARNYGRGWKSINPGVFLLSTLFSQDNQCKFEDSPLYWLFSPARWRLCTKTPLKQLASRAGSRLQLKGLSWRAHVRSITGDSLTDLGKLVRLSIEHYCTRSYNAIQNLARIHTSSAALVRSHIEAFMSVLVTLKSEFLMIGLDKRAVLITKRRWGSDTGQRLMAKRSLSTEHIKHSALPDLIKDRSLSVPLRPPPFSYPRHCFRLTCKIKSDCTMVCSVRRKHVPLRKLDFSRL